MLVVSGPTSLQAVDQCLRLSQRDADAFARQRVEVSSRISDQQDVGADPVPDVLPQRPRTTHAAARLCPSQPFPQSGEGGEPGVEVTAGIAGVAAGVAAGTTDVAE